MKAYSVKDAVRFSNRGMKKVDDLSIARPSKEQFEMFTIHIDSSSPAPSPPERLFTLIAPSDKHTMFLLKERNEG
jgi:hypothetical protein